jgi:hypothetical protein
MRFTLLIIALGFSAGCSSLTAERAPASYESLEPKLLLNKLKPFVSDGCPRLGKMISYPREDHWQLCCVEHDKAYWKGGSLEQKQQADSAFHSCVSERGSADAARLMYYSLRSVQKASQVQNWGYGWVIPHNTSGHTPEELVEIKKHEDLIDGDRVPTSTRHERASHADSLTQNRCMDASMIVLQRDLNKTVTPTQVYYESKSLVIGYEDTVKISSRECPLPYVFRFHLKAKQDCKANRSSPVQLDSFEIPAQCE